MARKSKADILAEERQRADEINAKSEERITAMLPGLVASITAEVTAKLSQSGGGGGMGADMRGFIQNMAVDLAKISDPRNERKTVSPEVAASREEGKSELMDLLIKAKLDYDAGQEPPIYILINKAFLGGVLFEPQQENATTHRMEDVEINWLSIPGQSMSPVCDKAKAIHAAYLKMISNGMGQLGSPPPGSWVITGNKIRRRGMFADEPPQMGTIRREEPAARQRKSIPVLGTLAEPLVEMI